MHLNLDCFDKNTCKILIYINDDQLQNVHYIGNFATHDSDMKCISYKNHIEIT